MDLKNPTRTESLLANIAGYTGVPVPDMKNATRSERLLKEILDNGGGGGDVTKEYVDNAIAGAVADIDGDISALSDTVADKVDKVNGKSLSTNDYTDADKALVQDSPITVTATASPISTANGKPRKLTIYGKSEVVDGSIKSAGEGWATVDLGTLDWTYWSAKGCFSTPNLSDQKIITAFQISPYLCAKYTVTAPYIYGLWQNSPNKSIFQSISEKFIVIHDTDYTTVSDFVTSLGNAMLCYQLADPTQGNAIAVKTDNGTGIDGTMATFTTGTPLYGVSDTVRDAMNWDGSAGTVTKNCGEVDLGTLAWSYDAEYQRFISSGIREQVKIPDSNFVPNFLCPNYVVTSINYFLNSDENNIIACGSDGYITIRNTTYTDPTAFKNSLNGVKLIYELATPTVTPLTQAENESLASLRTYSPSTTVTINGNPEYSIEAYANTANGQVISDMQPTRSPLLTLSASGWTNNAQTVTYEHNTGKRNSIDVEPASIKAWTAAGILATSETATSIAFECDTVPTADLSFRVTSMEVR